MQLLEELSCKEASRKENRFYFNQNQDTYRVVSEYKSILSWMCDIWAWVSKKEEIWVLSLYDYFTDAVSPLFEWL